MKAFITACLVLMIGCSAFAQLQGERFMLTAKLVAAPSTQADCGTMAIAQVYEFEVVMTNIDGYDQANIPVVVSCPELKGVQFFKIGATYKMEIFNEDQDGYSIINQDILQQYGLGTNYWAGDMKRID